MTARPRRTAACFGLVIGAILIVCHTARADPAPPQTAVAMPLQAPYSAAALYNLANAYARAGKPALAVLNYERASLLAPRDPDIEANLQYLRQRSHLPPEPPRRFARAVAVAGPTALAWMGTVGIVLIGASVLAVRAPFSYRWLRVATLVCGIALIGLTASNAVVTWPRLQEAVIVTAATPVRASPVPMGDALFELPEAETVRITAERDDFVLIRTGMGRTGWVSRANLVPVVPTKERLFF